MELLIPGLILVALMVYASTRIKKTVAAAFEPETVETDDFIVNKPEGFLVVLNGDPKYLFESYSKEFGSEGAESFRKATADLRSHKGATVDEVAAGIVLGGDVASDVWEIMGERRYRMLEITRVAKGIELRNLYKLGEKDRDTFEFRIVSIAQQTNSELRGSIDAMLNSFELK